MGQRYSNIFTLTDIFNNKSLKKKIPLINYKESESPTTGKVVVRTNRKTVIRLIYDNAVSEGRHYYKPIAPHWKGDRIEIGGKLNVPWEVAYKGILWRMRDIKKMIEYTANDSNMIRDALKEAEKNKRNTGKDSLLYLRIASMEQIAGMSDKQLQPFMNNVMENIYFSDAFAKTQKKYGIKEKGFFLDGKSYEEHKAAWERKVGYNG